MIMREQVQGYRKALDEVRTAALGDLRELLDGLVGIDADIARSVLFDAVPQVFDPYAITASNISATFYEESRAAAGSPTKYTPRALAEPVPMESWKALVGFGTKGEAFEAEGANAAYEKLAGGLTKRITEAASDTAYSNAWEDPDPVGFQRVPAPGCCGFCGMLASRGATYGSRASAGVVVGRGLPVKRNYRESGKRKPGGQAGGAKTRGKRAPGESFHDNCNCSVIAVHNGNAVEMQADADKYLEAYGEAASKINDGLELKATDYFDDQGRRIKTRYEWVDAGGKAWTPKERERAIAQAMNKDSEVLDAIAADAYPNRPPAHADLFEVATPQPSQGPSLTYENVKDLTDDELAEAMGTVFAGDPEAWDKLESIMERREAERLASVAAPGPEAFVDPFGTALDGTAGTDPAINPALRPERKLTPNERVAEEYWEYAANQQYKALEDLNGVLFNKKFAGLAREKGITEEQLFSGPFHVANKYASDELKEWWAANGRNTLTSYRYKALGRPSDRNAWLSVKKRGLDNAGISEARRENRRGL